LTDTNSNLSCQGLPVLQVRPYQLLCLICSAGGNTSHGASQPRLRALLPEFRRDPAVPVALRCNVTSHYAWQNPGHGEDTPEGSAFNAKRDLDVLRLIGLVPGDVRPAWELLARVFDAIPGVAGLCGYGRVDGPWRGCPAATSGWYEAGLARGLEALIPPRSETEMAAAKAEAQRIFAESAGLQLRPHHLMCMACFHAGREAVAPIAEDNLGEAVDTVQRHPEIPITLVQGPCMICPPCPHYDPVHVRCIRNNAMALRDERKDLDVLQRLDLQYGDVLPARTLFARLFAAVSTVTEICGSGDGPVRGWEWAACSGSNRNIGYAAARAAGLGIPGLNVVY
jgi:hypothetical protein